MRQKQVQEMVIHYPTLRTILAIEDAIRGADTAISRNGILARMPTKTMRSTLNVALDYLERRGLILGTGKGFVWTFNPDKRLASAEKRGLKV
jgi:hypothetical protein